MDRGSAAGSGLACDAGGGAPRSPRSAYSGWTPFPSSRADPRTAGRIRTGGRREGRRAPDDVRRVGDRRSGWLTHSSERRAVVGGGHRGGRAARTRSRHRRRYSDRAQGHEPARTPCIGAGADREGPGGRAGRGARRRRLSGALIRPSRRGHRGAAGARAEHDQAGRQD